MFTVYSDAGFGYFLGVGVFPDLESAKAACPPGSRIEQATDNGSLVVYIAP